MEYHFKIHSEKNNGFWAQCIEIPEAKTQADSLHELHSNMEEVINLVLDDPENKDVLPPFPKKLKVTKDIIKVKVDPKISFALILKRERLKRNLTQRQVADKLGLKNLYSYQRLESAKTANPQLTTISKVKAIFPNVRLEEVV
ncbi:type II toxin-antitoxin system HicB family antitoxin [Leptospira ilyithenensis]|uniref:Type II toxin-antitoxin system HicB family antitoxin n=1 Tax=Leptospira ilyithenensis TaxID=2484901 RepID=A0A4R9LT02_9LEPT|nr:type II toxin-antitoxin system HicB family antitoxin [Leptospira ilyithenensis]TGN13109.1 type II toxin-antitoxin system HicB family antitoxin [Leptospira ilyithenensis]